ncbi:NERD domain-containing protein (plasmid) [Deinococcus sp. KNUC1210]|uniref:nuclease-related domain-containing protein n=1 Tax=Deinococcus sp. KNUC1210 TaxID=2917691 RepID=UPI001EEFB302|nr:nuclease-related domain-containing protein [Deinococcus sp. KNUC1210]ULH17760.1 NERD domain-containing protein [Deinococcus sp. KNUC1210]
MIAKDYAAPPTADRFQRAGNEAEKQMAFYLKRAFGDDPAVHIFHNLRFEDGQDAAQIDHLVLHRSGAIIIESKSVTSSVSINERDEWTRQWNGRWTGMPSPVLQAKRQAEFLRKQLGAHREELLGKALFGLVQKGFQAFVIDVVVAISDQGVIQHRGRLPEVRKADQVVDRVRELMREQAGLSSLTSRDPRSKDWGITLKPEELTRTSAYLRNAHRDQQSSKELERTPTPAHRLAEPLDRQAATEVYTAVGPVVAPRVATPKFAPATPAFTCSKCASERLEVVYGQYGYYFKCLACDGNTRIDLKCSTCSGKLRTRKSQRQFFAECRTCDTSKLYFTNPA